MNDQRSADPIFCPHGNAPAASCQRCKDRKLLLVCAETLGNYGFPEYAARLKEMAEVRT